MGKISNSGKDERGQYHGGKAGDQTGEEWLIRDWYNRPWTAILRHPNANIREMIASYSEKAAANNHIGYDQYERTTFWNELKNSDYDPSNISNDCEADCSAGVAAIIKAIGFIIGDEKMQNVPETMWTGNEKQSLKNAGFDVLTDSKYLTSDSELVRGDVLLYHNAKKKTGHTAIYLSGSTEIQNGGKSVDELAKEVISGKWGNGDERKSKLTDAGYSYDEVQKRVNEMLKESSPAPAPSSSTYKVTAKSGINVRKGPGTGYDKAGCLSYGLEVEVESVNNGWAKLTNGNYVAANYISKV